MKKSDKRDAIRERAAEAIREMYHNASPHLYGLDTHGLSDETAQLWFDQAAQDEIEYISSGGAYAKTEGAYRHVLEANCNAGKYKSETARSYYVRWHMRQMREERAKFARWERINEYGKVYQWGRGGKTLAPDGLVNSRGHGFSMREDFAAELPIGDVVELIQIAESFNAYVERWNSRDNLQSMFTEANLADVDEAADLELCTD